jgi:hypothetical protein
VAGGDISARSQVQAVERLARGKRLEGNHNVVRASEFESVVAQTICYLPSIAGKFTFLYSRRILLVRPHSTPRA